MASDVTVPLLDGDKVGTPPPAGGEDISPPEPVDSNPTAIQPPPALSFLKRACQPCIEANEQQFRRILLFYTVLCFGIVPLSVVLVYCIVWFARRAYTTLYATGIAATIMSCGIFFTLARLSYSLCTVGVARFPRLFQAGTPNFPTEPAEASEAELIDSIRHMTRSGISLIVMVCVLFLGAFEPSYTLVHVGLSLFVTYGVYTALLPPLESVVTHHWRVWAPHWASTAASGLVFATVVTNWLTSVWSGFLASFAPFAHLVLHFVMKGYLGYHGVPVSLLEITLSTTIACILTVAETYFVLVLNHNVHLLFNSPISNRPCVVVASNVLISTLTLLGILSSRIYTARSMMNGPLPVFGRLRTDDFVAIFACALGAVVLGLYSGAAALRRNLPQTPADVTELQLRLPSPRLATLAVSLGMSVVVPVIICATGIRLAPAWTERYHPREPDIATFYSWFAFALCVAYAGWTWRVAFPLAKSMCRSLASFDHARTV